MNAHTNITAPRPDATEGDIRQTVSQLGWELAHTLDGYLHGEVGAVIFPAKTTDYSVSLMIPRDHNRMMRALYDYQRAYLAAKGAGWADEALNQAGLDAHGVLLASFDGAAS